MERRRHRRVPLQIQGFLLGNSHAFIYVEYNRPDGTGAGFAVWLRSSGSRWGIFDSELVWAARTQ